MSNKTPSVEFIKNFELFNLMQDSAVSKLLVDVRSIKDFEECCIRGAVNLRYSSEETISEDKLQIAEMKNWKSFKYFWDDKECSIKETKDWNFRGRIAP